MIAHQSGSQRDIVAGTWGVERMRELKRSCQSDDSMYCTVSHETFSDKLIAAQRERVNQCSVGKYANIRKQTPVLLTYGENVPMAVTSEISRKSLTLTSTVRTENTENDDPRKTISSRSLHRTESKFLHTGEAPMAKGRSGPRVERGVSTSGLLGEKLNLSSDPSKNSFVQKSWLYGHDPALSYKVNGIPEAYMPNDVSLSIGMKANAYESYQEGGSYGRRAVLTGDPLSKAGSRRAGVFMDEFPA